MLQPPPPSRSRRLFRAMQTKLSWLLAGPQAERARKSRSRIRLAMLGFLAIYGLIGYKMVHFATNPDKEETEKHVAFVEGSGQRPDILDRNGRLLATDVRRPSLFAEPNRIIDADEATEALSAVLPDLDYKEVRERLGSKKGFVWLKREISKEQQRDIHRLGLPGIGFREEAKRVYPNGPAVSHVLGYVNIDNQGAAGMERYLDSSGKAGDGPLTLSIDLRVQQAMRDELAKAREKYQAIAAAGVIMDANTGEIVSMVSVPDFDPNHPGAMATKDKNDPRINRLTTGVFEMGSTFKALTSAMALDSGRVNLNSAFDARFNLTLGRHTIHDFHGQRRVLTVPEIFKYSSNIGTARMALSLGTDYHRAFLKKMGLLDRLTTELPESARPLFPQGRWAEISTATISFGHGIAVAPLQGVMGVAALVNGGYLITPTFLRRTPEEARVVATRVLKPETSEAMRFLMRYNAEQGSGRSADVDGYYVGGKTGTSEKVIGGRYSKTKNINFFLAVFPADKPRYVSLVIIDEPKGIQETHFLTTSGFNAAPTMAKIITRAGPLLGLEPRFDRPPMGSVFSVNYKGLR